MSGQGKPGGDGQKRRRNSDPTLPTPPAKRLRTTESTQGEQSGFPMNVYSYLRRVFCGVPSENVQAEPNLQENQNSPETDPPLAAETDSDNDNENGQELEPDTADETDSDSESDSDNDSDNSDTDTDTDYDSDSDWDTNTNSDSDHDADDD